MKKYKFKDWTNPMEYVEYDSILEAAKDQKVFSIKENDGIFELREECDEYFCLDLTAQELFDLGNELIELSNVK